MGAEAIAAIAGLATSLAGTGYSIAASEGAKADQKKAVENQINQQQQMQKKNSALLGQNAQASTPEHVQKQIGAGQDEAQALYNKVNAVPLSQASGTGAATLGARNASVDAASQDAYAKMLQKPAAFMQGLQGQQVGQRIGNALTGSQMGVTNYLSGLNASTLPYLLQAAAGQGGEGQAIGSLLGSLGGLGSTYGASKGGLSGLYGDYSATNAYVPRAGSVSSDFYTSGQL